MFLGFFIVLWLYGFACTLFGMILFQEESEIHEKKDSLHWLLAANWMFLMAMLWPIWTLRDFCFFLFNSSKQTSTRTELVKSRTKKSQKYTTDFDQIAFLRRIVSACPSTSSVMNPSYEGRMGRQHVRSRENDSHVESSRANRTEDGATNSSTKSQDTSTSDEDEPACFCGLLHVDDEERKYTHNFLEEIAQTENQIKFSSVVEDKKNQEENKVFFFKEIEEPNCK